MTTQTITSTVTRLGSIVVLILASAFAYAAGNQESQPASGIANAATVPMTAAQTLEPLAAFFIQPPAQVQPAVLSSSLSYYFVSGNTFTPNIGSTAYFRQSTGCVNQMPLNIPFSAPVHLPQASQVVSLTVFTYDSAITTTISTASFNVNDGQGFGGSTVSASSQANTMGYQQHDSTQNNPSTVDNQNYNYRVDWVKTGVSDSPFLSLCGVRVAYYAPLGPASYLPVIRR